MIQYDYLIKSVIIGDIYVGKSSIIKRYVTGIFNEVTHHTIGLDFCTKMIKKPSYTCKLQLWDTSGQERFRSIISSYYRNAHIAFVVYSNDESFLNINSWIADAKNVNPDIKIFIIHNKIDLGESKYFDSKTHFKTSAKWNTGMEVFEMAVDAVIRDGLQKTENDNVEIRSSYCSPNSC